jgi:hypothetical protein
MHDFFWSFTGGLNSHAPARMDVHSTELTQVARRTEGARPGDINGAALDSELAALDRQIAEPDDIDLDPDDVSTTED